MLLWRERTTASLASILRSQSLHFSVCPISNACTASCLLAERPVCLCDQATRRETACVECLWAMLGKASGLSIVLPRSLRSFAVVLPHQMRHEQLQRVHSLPSSLTTWNREYTISRYTYQARHVVWNIRWQTMLKQNDTDPGSQFSVVQSVQRYPVYAVYAV